jgi:predicted transcriptional regulator of viral defense system
MSKKSRLFELADSQQGYFTSRQAVECGYVRTNFHRQLSSRDWIKEQRGIYRLAHYPITSRPDLVVWSLWSRDKDGKVQGVWSHETALELYELSDVMPAKLHMTVPKKFRKGTSIPKNLILYFSDLPKEEIRAQQGYKITTPLRTLIDIVEEEALSEDLIVQAIQDALKKGLLTRKQLNETTNFKRFLHDYKF